MKKSLILSVFAMLVGCGAPEAASGTGTGTELGAKPAAPKGFKAAVAPLSIDKDVARPDDVAPFPIDPGVGVQLYADSYAITTNGTDWILAWTGDVDFHEFYGEMISPDGSTLAITGSDGLYAGDTVDQVDVNRVAFDGITDGNNVQLVQVSANAQPVRFNIYIDGVPAVYAVVFPSGGFEATSDIMPFDLVTPRQGLVQRLKPAPQLKPKATADGKPAKTVFIDSPGKKPAPSDR